MVDHTMKIIFIEFYLTSNQTVKFFSTSIIFEASYRTILTHFFVKFENIYYFFHLHITFICISQSWSSDRFAIFYAQVCHHWSRDREIPKLDLLGDGYFNSAETQPISHERAVFIVPGWYLRRRRWPSTEENPQPLYIMRKNSYFTKKGITRTRASQETTKGGTYLSVYELLSLVRNRRSFS